MKPKSAARFVIKLVAFLLPFILLLGPFYASGELFNSGTIATLQQRFNLSILYGPAYTASHLTYYKAESTRILDPSVLIMGDSRPLQIRDFFFSDPTEVYNAGFATISTADMQRMLETMADSRIKTVIISLSHFSFNVNYQHVLFPPASNFTDSTNGSGAPLLTVANRLEADFAHEENSPRVLSADWDKIGMLAKLQDSGCLNDGSYYYGELFHRAQAGETGADRVADTLTAVEYQSGRFRAGAEVNPDAINHLNLFLEYCRDNGIYVVAFTPPYAPSVNEAMAQKKDVYAYHYELLKTAPGIFKNYGFEYYDYTDTASLGCSDDYFFDGYHPGDVVMLRMFVDMLQKGSRLNELCDIAFLRQYDTNRVSDLQLLGTWQEYNRLTLDARKQS